MRRLTATLRECSPLTRGLALFALANVAIVNTLAVLLPSEHRSRFPLHTTADFLLFRAGSDSWRPMSEAWAYLRTGASSSVYDYVYYDLGNKFQYPLTSLFPIEIQHAILGGDVIRFSPLNLLGWLAVWGTAILTALIFNQACREHLDATFFRSTSRVDRLARAGIAVVLAITFYPLVKGFTNGNIQTWIDFAFAAMVWLWMNNRATHAGFAAGLICLIKPQIGLLLIWAALRRQWGFAAAFVAVAGSGALAALALYGWNQNVDLVGFLSFAGRHGESYWPNQSVNGLLHRLLSNGPNTTFRENGGATRFAPYDPVVYVGTVVSSALLIGAALLWRRGEHARAGTLDLMVVSLTITMASPISWQHHYGILVPIYAVLLPAMLRWRVFGTATIALLAGSYVMTSNVFYVTGYAADTPFTPVQSYLLVGGLIALISLYAVRHAAAVAAVPVPSAEARRGHSAITAA
jgi:hypothetical protein